MKIAKASLSKFNFENLEKLLATKIYKVDLYALLVCIAIGVYTIVFSYFTVLKDYGFRTYAWDLGIFNQALWTTLNHGKFFYYTPELIVNPSGSFFGIHFSPILFIVLPIYAIYPAPQILLVLQSFVLALGALPLHKIVMHVLKYRVASLIFVSMYLMYPPLQGINWFDFHVQSFLPLFLLSTFYFLEKQNWKAYTLFTMFSLACEEHAAMIVLFIGFFIALQHRTHLISALKNRQFKDTILLVATGTIVLAVIWFLMTSWIRGVFFQINPSFLSNFKAVSNWSILGVPDPTMIPVYILLYPTRAIAALNYDFLAKIGYFFILFGPLAFRPLFKAKYLLPALPWFVYALFSNYQAYYVIYNQYPAYAIAFIFIAAVHAINNDQTVDLKVAKKRLYAMLICGVVASLVVSPLSPVVAALYSDNSVRPPTQHEELIYKVLQYLPANASVITHNNLFPKVSNRINAYALPTIDPIWNGKSSECVSFIEGVLAKVEYILVDIKSDSFSSSVVFSLMQKNHVFKTLVSADGIILFKKNYQGVPTVLDSYNVRYDYRSFVLYSGEIISAPNSTSDLVLHFNGSLGYSPIIWYGPRCLLPPGEYNVTARCKTDGTDELFTLQSCSDSGQNLLFSETFFSNKSNCISTWKNYTFHLTLDLPILDFEVRAVNASNESDLWLDYIGIMQITPEGT